MIRRVLLSVSLILLGAGLLAQGGRSGPAGGDPLPSWNEGPTKAAIEAFVARATDQGSAEFVPEAERIAVFDNDGTLWCEHPMYVQLAFALDRVKALAPRHPEWKEKEPFKSILAGNLDAAMAGGNKAIVELVMATHAGMSTVEFEKIVTDWLKTAQHPRFHRLYTELAYKPMVELLAYLRASGFKTYIVSGGGVEFMRPWTERVYGVPPEQVVGSMINTKFEEKGGAPVLERLPEVFFIDDGPGKPEGINAVIGRRPVAAFGNSDGDRQMLEWTAARPGSGARFMLLVHHDDAEREYAYDRDTKFGRLDKALTEAEQRGWTVVSMKRDWKTIFVGE